VVKLKVDNIKGQVWYFTLAHNIVSD